MEERRGKYRKKGIGIKMTKTMNGKRKMKKWVKGKILNQRNRIRIRRRSGGKEENQEIKEVAKESQRARRGNGG